MTGDTRYDQVGPRAHRPTSALVKSERSARTYCCRLDMPADEDNCSPPGSDPRTDSDARLIAHTSERVEPSLDEGGRVARSHGAASRPAKQDVDIALVIATHTATCSDCSVAYEAADSAAGLHSCSSRRRSASPVLSGAK